MTMTDRDRLTQLIDRTVDDYGYDDTDSLALLHEKVADAILADGWVRLTDADFEAGALAMADIASPYWQGRCKEVLAAAFGKDTPLSMVPAPGSRVLVVEEADSE